MKKLLFTMILSVGCMSAAEAQEITWETMPGKATFTDVFTYILAPSENPVYNSWEVTIEQNANDVNMYRLVNPYASWVNPYSKDIVYNPETDNSLVFYVVPDLNKAYFLIFNTGLSVDGLSFGVSTDVTYMLDFFDISFVIESQPELLGTFNNNEFTYSATYPIEDWDGSYMYFPSINGFFNDYDPYDYDNLIPVNEEGNFKIVLPNEMSKVEINLNETESEFYDLQGRKILNPSKGQLLIKKNNGEVKKVIF